MYGGTSVLDSRSDVVGGTLYNEERQYADQLLFPDPETAARPAAILALGPTPSPDVVSHSSPIPYGRRCCPQRRLRPARESRSYRVKRARFLWITPPIFDQPPPTHR
jgi:hypothetical protein